MLKFVFWIFTYITIGHIYRLFQHVVWHGHYHLNSNSRNDLKNNYYIFHLYFYPSGEVNGTRPPPQKKPTIKEIAVKHHLIKQKTKMFSPQDDLKAPHARQVSVRQRLSGLADPSWCHMTRVRASVHFRSLHHRESTCYC